MNGVVLPHNRKEAYHYGLCKTREELFLSYNIV